MKDIEVEGKNHMTRVITPQTDVRYDVGVNGIPRNRLNLKLRLYLARIWIVLVLQLPVKWGI